MSPLLKGQALCFNNAQRISLNFRHMRTVSTNIITCEVICTSVRAALGPEQQCGSLVATGQKRPCSSEGCCPVISISLILAQRRRWPGSRSPRVPRSVAIYSLVHPWQINRWFPGEGNRIQAKVRWLEFSSLIWHAPICTMSIHLRVEFWRPEL